MGSCIDCDKISFSGNRRKIYEKKYRKASHTAAVFTVILYVFLGVKIFFEFFFLLFKIPWNGEKIELLFFLGHPKKVKKK